jgi:hypothetical protein
MSRFHIYYIDFWIDLQRIHNFILTKHSGTSRVLGVYLPVVLALESAEILVTGTWFTHHLFETIYLMRITYYVIIINLFRLISDLRNNFLNHHFKLINQTYLPYNFLINYQTISLNTNFLLLLSISFFFSFFYLSYLSDLYDLF